MESSVSAVRLWHPQTLWLPAGEAKARAAHPLCMRAEAGGQGEQTEKRNGTRVLLGLLYG